MSTKRKSPAVAAAAATDNAGFGPIPAYFARCFSDTCPRAGECLRRLAGRHCDPDTPFVHAISPHYVGRHMADGCPQYRTSRRMRWALGFGRAMGTLPASQIHAATDLLIAMTSRTTFYRMRRGAIPLDTGQQHEIARILEAHGAPAPIEFDAYSEDYRWEQ